jgi:amino acid transporter
VLLMVFAYGGFESMVIAASETRDPRAVTGPALITAGAIVTLIYCLLQIVIVGVLPAAGKTTAPVAAALEQILGPAGSTIGSAAVIFSVYGWLTGFTLMMPRVLYSMARHHELPSLLGRVHPRFRTPHVAIAANAVVALAMGLYSSFAQAATFAAIARLTVFASVCAALIALKRQSSTAPSFRVPGSTAIAVAGVAFSVWLISTRSSSELWILGAIVVAGLLFRGIRTEARRDISAPRPY